LEDQSNLTDMVADIVAAYVSKNKVELAELPALIKTIYASLAAADAPAPPQAKAEPTKLTSAQIKKSITNDGLVSFVDGKTYKTLKRHLATYGLSAEAYKLRFGLPFDYPMTAPSYSAQRSAMAKSFGLGDKGRGGRPKARKANL